MWLCYSRATSTVSPYIATLPITFPNQLLNVQITNGSTSTSGAQGVGAVINTFTVSSFYLANYGNIKALCCYICIGY